MATPPATITNAVLRIQEYLQREEAKLAEEELSPTLRTCAMIQTVIGLLGKQQIIGLAQQKKGTTSKRMEGPHHSHNSASSWTMTAHQEEAASGQSA